MSDDLNRAGQRSHKRRSPSHLAKQSRCQLGLLTTVVLVVLTVIFAVLLIYMDLLPAPILIAVIAVIAAVDLLVMFLTWYLFPRKRFLTGFIIGIIMVILLIFGSIYVFHTIRTLTNITGNSTGTAHIAVYVKSDDSAQALNDTADYTFGILEKLDRSNTDQTISYMESELGSSLTTQAYSSSADVIQALYDSEVGAVILNSAYLDLLADLPQYADIKSQVRELTSWDIETSTTDGSASSGSSTAQVVDYGADGIFTVFLSGIDSREGLVDSSRCDSNIIAVVNRNTHQILLITTPRDYYVTISDSGGEEDKLTHAGIYGVECSMNTLEDLYGIDIDYYFRVNFTGFEDIINALGGITVYSEQTFDSTYSGVDTGITYHYDEGYNDLDGTAALYFARERYAFDDGDKQRGRNQVAVIKAVFEKMMTPAILRDYTSLLNALEGSFEMSVPYDTVASIVKDQLDNSWSWDIQNYAVTGTDGYAYCYSLGDEAYVMLPNQDSVDKASSYIYEILSNQIVTVIADDTSSSSESSAVDSYASSGS